MGQIITGYQHVPLRIPANWGGEARDLVIQLERLLDELYARTGRVITTTPLSAGNGSEAATNGLVTDLNSGCTFSQLRFYRTGNVVMMIGYISATSATLADGAKLFTLAENVRPAYGFGIPLLDGDRKVMASKGVQIASSTGDVTLCLDSSISSSAALRFAATYIVPGIVRRGG